jgi:hypothetical protein
MNKHSNNEMDNTADENGWSILSEAKRLLKSQPSPELWEIELRRILNGDRESELLRFGSVEEYVDKIRDLTKDRVVGEQSFNQALRMIIKSWRPEEIESKEYFACLIDLIAAYLPAYGVPKVLYFLDCLADFQAELSSSGGYGANVDLYLNTLVTLERYFPRPLLGEDDETLAFKSYLHILYKQLNDDAYSGYVASRLIDLGALSFDHEQIRDVIDNNPYALRELISLVFAPERSAWFSRDFGSLLEHSLIAGHRGLRVFEEVVATYGATLLLQNHRLLVKRNEEELLPLEFPITTVQKYISVLRRRQLGLDLLPTLLSEAPKRWQARAGIAQTLDRCVSIGEEGIALFEQELDERGAQIVYMEGEFKIALDDDCYPISLSEESAAKYGVMVVWSTGEKTKEDLEQETLEIVNEKEIAAGAGR